MFPISGLSGAVATCCLTCVQEEQKTSELRSAPASPLSAQFPWHPNGNQSEARYSDRPGTSLSLKPPYLSNTRFNVLAISTGSLADWGKLDADLALHKIRLIIIQHSTTWISYGQFYVFSCYSICTRKYIFNSTKWNSVLFSCALLTPHHTIPPSLYPNPSCTTTLSAGDWGKESDTASLPLLRSSKKYRRNYGLPLCFTVLGPIPDW